jgi:hypothetical protein
MLNLSLRFYATFNACMQENINFLCHANCCATFSARRRDMAMAPPESLPDTELMSGNGRLFRK